MPDSNCFTYRYAIRRPDGELLPSPKTGLGFSAIFGFGNDEEPDATPRPRTWDTRDDAEKALKEIRRKAAELGVGDWCGVIVQQLCTPFTFHDPAERFADEVQDWLNGAAE